MLRVCFRRSGGEMVAIVSQRANFVAVILPGDSENRERDFGELLAGWHHRVIIVVDHWVCDYALKIRRRITDDAIQAFERNVLLVSFEKFRAPKLRVGE